MVSGIINTFILLVITLSLISMLVSMLAVTAFTIVAILAYPPCLLSVLMGRHKLLTPIEFLKDYIDCLRDEKFWSELL